MPKVCKESNCENPRWSRVTGMCKYHHKPEGKPKVKKIRQKIKQVSSKRARENQAYNVMRKMFLEHHPNCAVFPELKATEIHHKQKRNGERLLDTTLWLAVSRKAHLYIHANPEESYSKGWLIKG